MVRIKQILKSAFPDAVRLFRRCRSLVHDWRVRAADRYVDKSEVFSRIYQNKEWGSNESASGIGSSAVQTEMVRRKLPEIVEEFGVKVVLDAPCGDFNWMKLVDWGEAQYIGVDIVDELIEANNVQYRSHGRTFLKADVCRDSLPRCDLVVCRDLLIHLSYTNCFSALQQLRKTGATYLLTTTYTQVASNVDIVTGSAHRLNLELPPFNFPQPLLVIPEGPTPDSVEAGAEAHPHAQLGRSLGLWRFGDLEF